jgi:hypothetical protein
MRCPSIACILIGSLIKRLKVYSRRMILRIGRVGPRLLSIRLSRQDVTSFHPDAYSARLAEVGASPDTHSDVCVRMEVPGTDIPTSLTLAFGVRMSLRSILTHTGWLCFLGKSPGNTSQTLAMTGRLTCFSVLMLIMLSIPARAGIKFDFNRDNQTYDWLTTVDHSLLLPGFRFNTSFNGESNLIKSLSNRWQENATARLESEKSIIGPLSFVTSAQYDISGLDKRRIRSSGLAAGLAYNPWGFFKITPMLRLDRIKRSDLDNNKSDQGAGYGIESAISPKSLGGINLSATGSFDHRNLTNIPSDEGKAALGAYKGFFDADTVWVNLQGLEASKKYYGTPVGGSNIVKQIKQERQGDFAMAMILPANLWLRVDGNAHLSRYLYRYPGLEEDISAPQRDNYGQGGGYKARLSGEIDGLASGFVGYTWNRASQDYQGVDLDQSTEVGELSFQGKMRISQSDSMSTDLVFGVTSYSNPHISSNREDRDQKTLLLNGRFSHILNRFFILGVTGGVNSFHQIYISGANSANNNQNNTYILSPYAVWRPAGPIILTQSFEIQANYITFDFDRSKKPPTRNRIFRRATSKTEFTMPFSSRLTWQQSYLYRYEDYGQLLWDDGWQQALSWDRRRNGLETRLIYSPDHLFQITPFFSWEKTNDYNHAVALSESSKEVIETRVMADEQLKMIFEVEVIFNWNHARRTRLDFLRRVRTFMSRPREINDYATISMEYIF